LALAYYKLGEYSNPLRIESFFSCMTVIARYLLGKKAKDHISTSSVRDKIKEILKERCNQFDEKAFINDWKSCYSDERCSIAHGKGSKIIDTRTSPEYEKLVNTVGGWTREVIYYYINRFRN